MIYFRVITKCLFEDDWGWPDFLGYCIHASSSFLEMDCLDAQMVFPMYIPVLLVMKKSMSGMFLKWCLTSSFGYFSVLLPVPILH